jgi:hypothetical protein
MLARLVLQYLNDSRDVPLHAILVYERLREIDAGLFEIAAGASDAV